MSILNCAYESFIEIEINFSQQLSILNNESQIIANCLTSLLHWISYHGDLKLHSELIVIVDPSHKYETLLFFSLLAGTSYWTNIEVAGDLRCHVTSL